MVLATHIVIALASLIVSGYLMVHPQKKLLRLSYTLIGLTLTTGTVLVFNGANVWHVCLSGLVYTLLVSVATEVARRRSLAVSRI